jgi:hypothetical protein
MKLLINIISINFCFNLFGFAVAQNIQESSFTVLLTERVEEKDKVSVASQRIVDVGLLGKKQHLDFIKKNALVNSVLLFNAKKTVVWCFEKPESNSFVISWSPLDEQGKFDCMTPFSGKVTWDEFKKEIREWKARGIVTKQK